MKHDETASLCMEIQIKSDVVQMGRVNMQTQSYHPCKYISELIELESVTIGVLQSENLTIPTLVEDHTVVIDGLETQSIYLIV